jgi:hypothetical protein
MLAIFYVYIIYMYINVLIAGTSEMKTGRLQKQQETRPHRPGRTITCYYCGLVLHEKHLQVCREGFIFSCFLVIFLFVHFWFICLFLAFLVPVVFCVLVNFQIDQSYTHTHTHSLRHASVVKYSY